MVLVPPHKQQPVRESITYHIHANGNDDILCREGHMVDIGNTRTHSLARSLLASAFLSGLIHEISVR